MKEKLYTKINDSFHNLGECIINKLQIQNGDQISVKYSRTSQAFQISLDPEFTFTLPCFHSITCPMLRVQQELNLLQVIPKLVPVFSSVLVRSLDQKILIMRQTETLGLACKSWGFSYRKVQLKESIFKAGLRALREDTGVNIVESGNTYSYFDMQVEITPLCIYESIFPKILEHGLPRNQALMVFCLAEIPMSASEIKLKLNNVDFLVWLGYQEFNEIQSGEKGFLEPSEFNMKLDYGCLKGISPNSIGEGFSEGHFIAYSAAFSK